MMDSFKALLEKIRSNVEHRIHLADELEALEARIAKIEAYLPKPADTPTESASADVTGGTQQIAA